MSRLTDHRGGIAGDLYVIRSRLAETRERAVASTAIAEQGR